MTGQHYYIISNLTADFKVQKNIKHVTLQCTVCVTVDNLRLHPSHPRIPAPLPHFMPLPNFILSPEVEVAILTLYKDECDEYEDVFTIILKRGWQNCGKWDEWKTEAMARQRNRNTLDNRMDELRSAFLIHCHPRQHRVFLSNNLWFILYCT